MIALGNVSFFSKLDIFGCISNEGNNLKCCLQDVWFYVNLIIDVLIVQNHTSNKGKEDNQ